MKGFVLSCFCILAAISRPGPAICAEAARPSPRETLRRLDAAIAELPPGLPTAFQLYNSRARVLLDLGSFERAEADGLKSVSLMANGEGWLRVAAARLYLGRYAEALEAADKAASMSSRTALDLAQAHLISGCAFWRLGEPEALDELRKAEALDPRLKGLVDEWTGDRLFSCLPDKAVRRVYALSEEAARLMEAGDKDLRTLTADREAAVQRIGEALAISKDGLESHHLHNLRARAYNLLDQPMMAYEEAARSVRLKPRGNPAACLELAVSGLLSARGEQASKGGHYEAALKNAALGIEEAGAPDSSVGPGVLARLYRVSGCAKLGLGKAEEARADFKAMAGADPALAPALQAFLDGRAPCEDRAGGGPKVPAPAGWPVALLLIPVIGAAAWGGVRLWRARKAGPGAEIVVRASAGLPEERLLAGRYELTRMIGRGGMGAVYEGMDRSLGRPVALKKMAAELLRRGSQGREIFLKEARSVAALRHSAIVEIYSVMEQGADLYLIFELVKGKTVQQLLVERKRLGLGETVSILRPVCQALQYAHDKGMVHRDVKPANIMATESGGIKLMDFGIARSLLRGEKGAEGSAPAPVEAPESPAPFDAPEVLRMDRTKTLVGTKVYMSPEAFAGVVCREGDVYGLGIVLYEMLTGVRPFREADGAAAKVRMAYTPASARVPGLPAGVDDLIALALQPIPDKRLPNPREFLDRLEAVAGA